MAEFQMPPMPKDWGKVCKKDKLCGLVSEADLKQLVEDCEQSEDYDKRVAALGEFTRWMHGSNQLLSDLLTYEPALPAIYKARDEMKIALDKMPETTYRKCGFESNWAMGHTLIEKLTGQPGPFTSRIMQYLPQVRGEEEAGSEEAGSSA